MKLLKGLMKMTAAMFAAVLCLLVFLWPRNNYLPEVVPYFHLERLMAGPIIEANLSGRLSALAIEQVHVSINGP